MEASPDDGWRTAAMLCSFPPTFMAIPATQVSFELHDRPSMINDATHRLFGRSGRRPEESAQGGMSCAEDDAEAQRRARPSCWAPSLAGAPRPRALFTWSGEEGARVMSGAQ